MVIGVTQETVPTAMSFSAAIKWDDKIPIAVDENKTVHSRFSVERYPTTVLMDRRGIVRWRGVDAKPADIDAEVAKLLAEPAPGSGK